MKKLIKAQLIDQLNAIADRQRAGKMDQESDHADADALLLDFIADDSVRDAYDRIGKWYA